MSTPHVYTAIANVMATLARDGISKGRRNQQQGYQFRGIDDVYNALAPVLSSEKLIMLPRVLSRHVVERQTKSGGALFYVTVDAEFDLVSAEDGSKHTIRTCGEAMDSADKATNKAMSAAYKYAAMQAFCIPTEGDNDADAHTHDVAPRAANNGNGNHGTAVMGDGPDFYQCPVDGVEVLNSNQAKKAGLDDAHTTILNALREAPSYNDLKGLAQTHLAEIARMPLAWRQALRDAFDERLAELRTTRAA